jgi:transcriptional regulator with XRE-family HTH domain
MDRHKLKGHRKRLGLSLAEAAAQVEIAPRSWARYESGERRIPPSIIRLFCLINRIPLPPRRVKHR